LPPWPRASAACRRSHQVDGAANEFGRDSCEPVRKAIAVAVFIGDVLAFDVAQFTQGLPEGPPHRRIIDDADARHFCRVLCPCGERQGCSAAQEGDKFAASHSGTFRRRLAIQITPKNASRPGEA
jgi:hypothetical protein